jgi:WD40 repeat protein
MTASPDGRTVAISQLDGPMRCFDAATSSPVPAPIQERGFSAVGWSPDGKRFAAARGNTIRVVGAGTDPQADAPISDVNAVAFSPDGRSIALYDFHGSVGVADVATGAIRARFDAREWGGHLAWTPDGTTVVVGMRGPRVAAFDAATGAASWSLDPDPISGGLGHSARIAGDASCAAWLGTDAVVRILDLRGDRARATDVPTATNGAWSGLALSAAARRVALLQEVPDAENPQRTHTTLRVWNVGARTPCAEIRVVGHGNLALSADGRRAAVAGEQRADVYDLEASPPSRTSASWSVRERRWSQGATPAFSSDGTLLAVGDADGVVRVFAVPSCAEIATLRGHRAGVESLAFSPDGTRLVSGSADTTALVWDLTKLPAAPSASPAPK